MKKLIIEEICPEGKIIHYKVREDSGLGLLQHEVVDIFIRFDGDENCNCDLSKVPDSILIVPIFLYILPITYFFNVELIVPILDKNLFERLPLIYNAYSKIYGPFKSEWRGKITINKITETAPSPILKYEKAVFFSGGVDACHAAINNPGEKSLLVSIPDIERDAENDGPLRLEKFSLIKNFSKITNSDWLLISNNFNTSLFNESVIFNCLSLEKKLNSQAYKYDGWGGIRYLANMCSVAPIAYLNGIKSLVMGSSFEQIEDQLLFNYDGSCPELSDTIGFGDIAFSEQDGLLTRRSQKVKSIIEWCKSKGKTTKMWVCFSNSDRQCGYCIKCLRTQLNILCAGENPLNWGFDNFDEEKFSKYIKSYRYLEFNPCWMWDIIDNIKDDTFYPYCNYLLHWLKSIGYKKYNLRAARRARLTLFKRLFILKKYPHYIKLIIKKVFR